MNKFFLVILFLTTLNSCLNFKTVNNKVLPIDQSNYKSLDGVYSSTVDTLFNSTIADFLIMDYENKYGKFDPKDSVNCRIEMLSPRTMKMEVYRNSKIDMGLKYKGKLRNGYFEFVQKKLTTSYFLFVLRIIEKRKARIGVIKNENHDLMIETKSFETASWFYIRTAHYYDEFDKVFLRKDG